MADPSFPGSNQGQSYPLADKTKQPIPPDDLLAPGYSPQPTHDYPPAAGRPYLAQPHVAYPAATGYPPQPVADQPGYPPAQFNAPVATGYPPPEHGHIQQPVGYTSNNNTNTTVVVNVSYISDPSLWNMT